MGTPLGPSTKPTGCAAAADTAAALAADGTWAGASARRVYNGTVGSSGDSTGTIGVLSANAPPSVSAAAVTAPDTAADTRADTTSTAADLRTAALGSGRAAAERGCCSPARRGEPAPR
jgi:hypothetical protein